MKNIISLANRFEAIIAFNLDELRNKFQEDREKLRGQKLNVLDHLISVEMTESVVSGLIAIIRSNKGELVDSTPVLAEEKMANGHGYFELETKENLIERLTIIILQTVDHEAGSKGDLVRLIEGSKDYIGVLTGRSKGNYLGAIFPDGERLIPKDQLVSSKGNEWANGAQKIIKSVENIPRVQLGEDGVRALTGTNATLIWQYIDGKLGDVVLHPTSIYF